MVERRTVLVGLVGVLIAGCSSGVKSVPVRGKLVTKAGTPFRLELPPGQMLPPGDPGIRVKFIRGDEAGQRLDSQFFASVNAEEGTFEIPGNNGKGIPPGKYLVTVSVGAAGGTKDDGKKPGGRPGGGPPAGGPPGAGAPSMDGKEVTRTEVTIPEGGTTDLVIEVDVKSDTKK